MRGLTDTLAKAAEHEQLVFLCSFQKEESVILDELLALAPHTRVVTIDTGVLFPETLQTWRAFEERFSVHVDVEDAANPDLPWTGTPHCCGDLKVAALERALAGADAWITGIRREQAATRANAQFVEFDDKRSMWKYNPLADWTERDLWRRIHERDLPYHPLHDQGYASIGCAPCTQPGQRPRGSLGGDRQDRVRAPRRMKLTHLQILEAEAIHVMREVAAELERPVLLFSGGKDSIVLLRLAEKAFRPARFPFPLMHVDTGHNFPEVIEFRDRRVAELGERLIVASVQDSIDAGRVVEEIGPRASRNRLQTTTLLDAIAEHGFDAAFGGARRDEERARAKERIMSFRDDFGGWDPKAQRPELWNIYNGRIRKGEHVRVFPLSNWTELDVWEYIESEDLEVPSIYFAHEREVFRRDGMLYAVSQHVQFIDGEQAFVESVRYRTVGDMSCTGAVASTANALQDVVAEIAATTITERGETRADDKVSEAAMEDRKVAGYF